MIFLGAGASTPFEIPTSPKLTEKMRNLLKKEKVPNLLNSMEIFLKDNNKQLHYENMLILLISKAYPLEIPNEHFSHSYIIPKNIDDKKILNIIDKMNKIVCDSCTSPFIGRSNNYIKPEKLDLKFQMTYDSLIGIPLKLGANNIIFSTNYDPSLELWCQKRDFVCIDGTKTKQNPEIKELKSNEDYTKDLNRLKSGKMTMGELPRDGIGLVRLHGSVWTYEHRDGKFIKFNRPKDCLFFSDL